jgi:archaemetzincin
MSIYIAPLKFSNSALLSFILKELQRIFSESSFLNQKIEVLNLDVDIEKAYSKERAQYYSTKIISEVIKKTESPDGKIIVLTDVDLYIPVLTFVFGEAQLDGKHSIVSICRLHEEFYSGITNDKLLIERTIKEILHELGHNYGLIHCIDWDCVMHSSTSIEEVDIKGGNYCKECGKKIKDIYLV